MNKASKLTNRAHELVRNYINRSGQKTPALRIESNADDSTDVFIYDEIDSFWGLDVNDIADQVSEISTPLINVRINSPGGDVFDGVSLMTAFHNHDSEIHTYIDGVAASMASGIAMSGTKIHMSQGAFMMIHEPWMLAAGNASDFRDAAELLDLVNESLAKNYSKQSLSRDGITHEAVLKAMSAETWYDAESAKEAGFVDEIIEIIPIQNTWTGAKNIYENTPEKLVGQFNTANNWRIKTERQLEQFLRDAGCSNSIAKKIASSGIATHRDDVGEGVLDALNMLNKTIQH